MTLNPASPLRTDTVGETQASQDGLGLVSTSARCNCPCEFDAVSCVKPLGTQCPRLLFNSLNETSVRLAEFTGSLIVDGKGLVH